MKFLVAGLSVLVFCSFLLAVISASVETGIHEGKSAFKIFPGEFLDDLKLVLKSALYPLRQKNKMEWLKNLQQIGLYMMEVLSVCGLLLIFAQWLNPVSPRDPRLFCYEQAMRFIGFYTAYQFLVFSILNLTHSAERDSWLAVLRIVRLAKLYLSTRNESVKDELDFRIRDALFPYTFMGEKPKAVVGEVKARLRDKDAGMLDYYEIVASHNLEAASLFWRFSLLLNAIKGQGGAERDG